jgi:hypothetical protein
LVTNQVATGNLYLIDATGAIGSANQVQLTPAKNVALQMNSTPDSPPTASTVLVSFWQQGLLAISAEVFWSCEFYRSGSVAKIDRRQLLNR